MAEVNKEPDLSISEEERSRRPAPQFNAFRSWVTDELFRRRTVYGTEPDQSDSAFFPASPFVRFTSCLSDSVKGYSYFTLGLHGFYQEDLDIFDVSYRNRDIVGYATDLNAKQQNGKYGKRLISADELTEGAVPPTLEQNLRPEVLQQRKNVIGSIEDEIQTVAHGVHPVPGVINVRVNRKNLGAPMIVDVQWVCYNRSQMEFLRNHFMMAGRYVVLEFGNQFANKKIKKTLDFTDITGVTDTLSDAIFKGRKWVIDKWVKPNDGNYDFIVGMVGNFNVQLDAATNTYTCSTTVYTMGENMWGFSIYDTVTNKANDQVVAKVSAISDFFKLGGVFDQLVMNASGDQSKVIPLQSDAQKDFAIKTVDNKEISKIDAKDRTFVSWAFFVNVIIGMVNKCIENSTSLKEGILKFSQIVERPTSDDKETEDWISDSAALKSTDPDTLLIVKSVVQGASSFAGAGYFDKADGGEGWRGKLSQGVWLNTGMIREVFLGSKTVADAMNGVLGRMNNATANYWKLKLFYDEEFNSYKVIDLNCVNNKRTVLPPFYKFNKGGEGETLEVNLDSAFPPELVTQMALYAWAKTKSPAQQKELMEKYPTIGTTSSFIFSLNWTNLEDKLQQAIQAKLPKEKLFGLLEADDTYGLSPAPDTRVATRVLGADNTNVNGMYLASTTTGTPSGKPVGTLGNTVGSDEVKMQFPAYDPKNPVETGRFKTNKNASIRNNNPGNVKWSPALGLPKGDPVKHLITGKPLPNEYWVKFPTVESGFLYIVKIINNYKQQFPNFSLNDAMGRYILGPNPDQTTLEQNTNFNARVADACKQLRCIPATRLLKIDSVSLATILSKQESELIITPKPAIVPVDNSDVFNGIPSQIKAPADASRVPFKRVAAEEPTGADGLTQQESDAVKIEADNENLANRYGAFVATNLVHPFPSQMRNQITQHGYKDYPSKPNAYVCPFPTTTNVTIKIQGISGISVSDGFYVDRLPYVFDKYGCFQVVEIFDTVTPQGWFTEIRGYFKLLFLNGEGIEHETSTPTVAKSSIRNA
jgi:hypothetical protein